ncbi:MAG: LysR family transcriptional regulator [Lactobacillus porci]|nr:LysR family transcriptional regulator [Lactobacillus porci]MDD6719212.1 LysR family transcriptional regulator [Lactobacillus porci]
MTREKTLIDILQSAKHCRSITEIASRLYLSQPYVSKLLKECEDRYQTVLIKRDRLPISLTEAGETFLEDLMRVVERQSKLESDMANYAHVSREATTIAMNQPGTMVFMPYIASGLRDAFPGTKFNFIELTTDIGEQNLLSGTIDIFFGKILANELIKTIPVFRSEVGIYVPQSHPLYQPNLVRYSLQELDLAKFSGQEFIGLSGQSFFQQMVDHMFSDAGVTVKTPLRVPTSFGAMTTAIKTGMLTMTPVDMLQVLPRPLPPHNLADLPEGNLGLDMGVSCLASRKQSDLLRQTQVLSQLLIQARQEFSGFKA